MADSRAPRLRLAVCVAVLVVAGLAIMAGCKKQEAGAGRRLAMGGEEALEEASDAAAGAEAEATAEVEAGAAGTESSGPAGRGAGRRGAGGGGGPGAGRGGPGGSGGRRGGGRGGGARAGAGPGAMGGQTAAAPPEAGASAEAPAAAEETSPPETGIPEVDKMARVREFAALFGPTTLIKSKDWDDTEFEWVSVNAEGGKVKGQQIVMPARMVTDAEYLEVLEGYFPIYVRGGRSLGEIVSKETIIEPRQPKRSPTEVRKLELAVERAAAAAAAAAAAEAAGEAAAVGGPGRGGMRGGGRAGRGRRGGRGGGRWG